MENRKNIKHDFEVINNLDQGIKEGEGQKGVHKCELHGKKVWAAENFNWKSIAETLDGILSFA